MDSDNLLQEFPPVSTQAWEEVILRDLKGADYAKKLIWQTDEGIAVKPYYRSSDIENLEYLNATPDANPGVRYARPTGEWRIREEIEAAGLEEANRAALNAVVAGAEEISFRNVAVENNSDLGLLLANLQEIPVHFECADEALIRLLLEMLAKRQRVAPVSTGWNPLLNLDFAAEVYKDAPSGFTPFTVHGDTFQESGANAIQRRIRARRWNRVPGRDAGAGARSISPRPLPVQFCNWLELLFPDGQTARLPHELGAGRLWLRRQQRSLARTHSCPHFALEQNSLTILTSMFCAEPPKPSLLLSAVRIRLRSRPSTSATRDLMKTAAAWRATLRS